MGRRRTRRKPAFEIEPLNWVAPDQENVRSEENPKSEDKRERELEANPS